MTSLVFTANSTTVSQIDSIILLSSKNSEKYERLKTSNKS